MTNLESIRIATPDSEISMRHGSSVALECSEGFAVNGDDEDMETITCVDGKWTQITIKCYRKLTMSCVLSENVSQR